MLTNFPPTVYGFLLPALQINNILGQTNLDEVRHALETLPRGLAENLAATIERIKKQHSESETRSRLAFLVLKWLSTVRRPITTQELRHAIATQPGIGTLKLGAFTDPKFFVECCFGLTVIDKETSVVRLVHFSVNEFLHEKREELFDNPDSSLAASCLTYMAIAAPGLGTVQEWPFWDYAACYWGIHAENSCDGPAEAPLRSFAFSPARLKAWVGYVLSKQWARSDRSSGLWLLNFIAPDPSALHLASIFGLEQTIVECLERGIDVNKQDATGATPLMLAAAIGRESILNLLLSRHDVDINALEGEGKTALTHAAENKCVGAVRLLLDTPGINVNIGRVISLASQGGWMSEQVRDMVVMVLSHPSFNLRAQEHEGVLDAAHSLARETYFDLAQELLSRPDFAAQCSEAEKNKMVDLSNYWLNTDYDLGLWLEDPVRIAGVPVSLLFFHKLFPGTPDFLVMRMLWSFVYYAFIGYPSGHYDSEEPYVYGIGFWDSDDGDIRRTLRHRLEVEGISFLTCDSSGRGFLHCISELSCKWPGMKLDVVRLVLRHGGQVSLRDKQGLTPLHFAAWEGDEEVARELIAAGADLQALDATGSSILHYVARGRFPAMIKLLVEAGADIHATDQDGNTPLHFAAERSSDPGPMIRCLIGLRARLDAQNNYNFTPGMLSAWGQSGALVEFVKLLEDPFEPDAFGNSIFLHCVYTLDAEKAQVCLTSPLYTQRPKLDGALRKIGQDPAVQVHCLPHGAPLHSVPRHISEAGNVRIGGKVLQRPQDGGVSKQALEGFARGKSQPGGPNFR